ncbi:CMD domain protein [Occultella aeris]|uniref:CMD domain protein n=1 Tax=Occultella aeris TaxID=2761496 RepID=A0A7M4DIL3_9MICO|nr:CMD domain protein [Occultella aeris]VZO36823.1 hypothetical protein HALOF300_01966 [Occultella aeris]
MPDVINTVLDVAPGDRLDRIRDSRPAAKENSQRTYDALFAPVDTADVTRVERLAVAAFVSRLHRQEELADHYAVALGAVDANLLALVVAQADAGSATGPYGVYAETGLAAESSDGLRFAVSEEGAVELGSRLSAALEHAHLLVFRPREASPEALQALLDAGWSTTGVVTLSQLVAFLSYQIREVHGLRVLATTEA